MDKVGGQSHLGSGCETAITQGAFIQSSHWLGPQIWRGEGCKGRLATV